MVLIRANITHAYIAERNQTVISEFIFSGFTDRRELQISLFILFLVVYIITLVGNLGMITLIKVDTKLNTPMYFFLSNLSFVDICYSSNVTPRLLANLVDYKAISFTGCLIQCYLFIALVLTESFILAAMAYDRYVAICNPLMYATKMSRRVCVWLMVAPSAYSFLDAMIQTIFTFRLTFCGSNIINHFYCADPPLLKLSCSKTHVKLTLMLLSASFNLISSLVVILISYLFILSTILKIQATEARYKAFSTCGSHLTAVIIFYGTLFIMYVRRPSSLSLEHGKIVSLFYVVVIPMLNPLIYSLRNKEVKSALKRFIKQKLVLY
ncbi:olfactory receptor 5M11-like [Hemicordylus capensis]|uniref:olfactory receptor 5M11-like n=1 Tax=Hemicordylus capensis TaxID=884348 RepID=UPI00230427B5|nr:olfactory receptor 5M11-like [Hemicordylus capensis]